MPFEHSLDQREGQAPFQQDRSGPNHAESGHFDRIEFYCAQIDSVSGNEQIARAAQVIMDELGLRGVPIITYSLGISTIR